MFKKFKSNSLIYSMNFLLMLSCIATTVTSLGSHGEPDCPKELLK